MSGFHGAFATGVASQQGTLTLPDTWFRPPFWDLLMLQLLRPNSSNLPCLYSTFHIEYPLVLSRFCPLVYDKSPYTIRKRKSKDNTKTPPKLRLHNDCGPHSQILCHYENYMSLTYETKIIRPGRFFKLPT